MKKPEKIALFILAVFFFISGCNDENEPADLTRVTIAQNSELFELIQAVLQRGDDPVENTVCIDFVYPFTLFLYDAAFHPQGTVRVYSDDEFSQLLGTLNPDLSISISYPIQTALPDGTIFSVNNDQQLKLALDSCSREDIIGHCNSLFSNQTCVWKMPYPQNSNSEFAESVFKANDNGTITFRHRGTDYLGTWVFLFLNNRLYLNINLEGTSAVAQEWNHNYLVHTLYGNTLQISYNNTPRNFKKVCSDNIIYELGQVGPNGGIVAYDKGEYTNGWRYIEVATSDLTIEEWGCNNAEIEGAQYDEIGTGYQNTIAIAQFHNNLNNFYLNPSVCSINSNGTVTAVTALSQIINTNDWFVPSINELEKIHENLTPLNLGNFENTNYWSSSEFSPTEAKCFNFSVGESNTALKNDATVKTRLIRYF